MVRERTHELRRRGELSPIHLLGGYRADEVLGHGRQASRRARGLPPRELLALKSYPKYLTSCNRKTRNGQVQALQVFMGALPWGWQGPRLHLET